MLAWMQSLFFRPRKAALPPRRGAVLAIRARYDAATTSDDNRRHWANADGLSANTANSAEVRRILRNRARYEVANNSYARGIVLTLANDVVGTGPRLQLLTDNPRANRWIEREFGVWAKAVGLPEKLRTMRMARAQDGEAFAVLTSNPKLPTSVQLDLRLIEADQVCTPDLSPLADNAIDGIIFDSFGNPVEYHVLKQHPGDGYRTVRDYDRVPAEAMLHWFRADRPGQARGIPDLTPALPLFAQLRRYTLAVIAAAETAADFAGILYTDAPASGEADAALARAEDAHQETTYPLIGRLQQVRDAIRDAERNRQQLVATCTVPDLLAQAAELAEKRRQANERKHALTQAINNQRGPTSYRVGEAEAGVLQGTEEQR